MIRRTFVADDEVEAAALEQALAMVRELKALAAAWPDGHVLAAVEAATVDRGRRYVRDSLLDFLNAQAGALERKGGAHGFAPAARPTGATARPGGGWSAPPAS